jgi:hypothetical protein
MLVDDELARRRVGFRQFGGDIPGHGGQVGGPAVELGAADARQFEQIVDQLRHARRGGAHAGEIAASGFVKLGGVVFLEHAREAVDGAQGRAQVEGHGVGKRFELVVRCLQLRGAVAHTVLQLDVQVRQILGRLPALGDVVEDARGAGELAVFVVAHMLGHLQPADAAVAARETHFEAAIRHGAQPQLRLPLRHRRPFLCTDVIRHRPTERLLDRDTGDSLPGRVEQRPSTVGIGLENNLPDAVDHLAITGLTLAQRGLALLQRGDHTVEGAGHVADVLRPADAGAHVRFAVFGASHGFRQFGDRPRQAARELAQDEQEDDGEEQGNDEIEHEDLQQHARQRGLALHHAHETEHLLLALHHLDRGIAGLAQHRGDEAPGVVGFRFQVGVALAAVRQRGIGVFGDLLAADEQGPPAGMANLDPRDVGKRQRGLDRIVGILGRSIEQGQHALAGQILGDVRALIEHGAAYLAAALPRGQQRGRQREEDDAHRDGDVQLLLERRVAKEAGVESHVSRIAPSLFWENQVEMLPAR